MEVQKNLHPVLLGFAGHLDHAGFVSVTTAVAHAVSVVWIVPDPQADPVDPGVSQNLNQAGFFAVKVVELNAGVNQSLVS